MLFCLFYVGHKTTQMQSETFIQLMFKCIRMHNLCNGMTSCISVSERSFKKKKKTPPPPQDRTCLHCLYVLPFSSNRTKKIKIVMPSNSRVVIALWRAFFLCCCGVVQKERGKQCFASRLPRYVRGRVRFSRIWPINIHVYGIRHFI
jgi:hypothetical protein